MLLNLWLSSKDIGFIRKAGLGREHFFVLTEAYDWVESFYKRTGKLPAIETLATEFEDVRKLEHVEPISYLSDVLKEQKAYTEFRPVLSKNAELVSSGKTIDAMWQMRSELDRMLKTYAPSMERYDWVKNALERYDLYMEKHGQTGLAGIPTGHSELDKLTGGWRDDDLILVSGRLSEGKSLVGGYFGYHAWKYIQQAGVDAPVIYITTEMPELEIAYRLDTLRSHFSNKGLMEGKLQEPELYRDYLEELSQRKNSFMILSQESNGGRAFTPNDIRAIVESEKPAFLIVDQLYDIADPSGESDIRKRIVKTSNAIREINLSTKTPTILLAQSGRAAARKEEDATPELHEIQESDNPAQKATRAITLRLINNERFKLSLKKNRGGKRNEDVYFKVDIDSGRWYEETVETSAF